MTLNDKQIEAINHKEGPCLVLAGAGSGKTRVLTERIVKLIDDGVSPYNILAITFTNKAAKEMRERVEVKLDGGADSIFIGTFHSFGLRILRENYADIGYTSNITILDTDDSKALIKRILKENEYDPKDYDIKTIISKISSAKNDGISPEEYKKLYLREEDQVIGLVYEKYLKLLKENNSVDFDDLLLNAVTLLENYPEVKKALNRGIKFHTACVGKCQAVKFHDLMKGTIKENIKELYFKEKGKIIKIEFFTNGTAVSLNKDGNIESLTSSNDPKAGEKLISAFKQINNLTF
jgi:DNA helicase-2/ATP-dependent DNA helicase PcrA